MFLNLELYTVTQTVIILLFPSVKSLPESSHKYTEHRNQGHLSVCQPKTKFKQWYIKIRKTLLYTVKSTLFPSKGEGI